MFGRRKRNEVADRPGELDASVATVATIDDENFLVATEGGITLVDFWAPWCGPCRAFAPIFEEVAARAHGRVRFARCNTDDSPVTATTLHITSIPTVIAFGPDGSELGRIIGVPCQADLERAVADLEQRA